MKTIEGLWKVRFEFPEDVFLPFTSHGGNVFLEGGRLLTADPSHHYSGIYTIKKDVIFLRFSATLAAAPNVNPPGSPSFELSLTGKGILDTSRRKIAAELEIDEWPNVSLIARFTWLCELP